MTAARMAFVSPGAPPAGLREHGPRHRRPRSQAGPPASLVKSLTETQLRAPDLGHFAGLSDAALRRLFERHPHGLALIDRAGAIRAANDALVAMLDLPRGAPRHATTCCAALGC